MSIALVLAGHGSHISPNTAGVVWGYVDELRQRGIADEITAAFWKEQPEFSQVLKTLTSDIVIVIPLFTATGYFSRQIIPYEMRLAGKITQLNGRTIYYTQPIGEHPAIQQVVIQRVHDVIQQFALERHETAVAVIGHGTKRSKTTRDTVKTQVKRLERTELVNTVVDAYLDDDPDIPTIYERTSQPNIITVPFFLAVGSHTTMDVPDSLGITYGEFPAQVNQRKVYYTQPIGTEDVILDIIIQLAKDTGIQITERAFDNVWSNIPCVGAQQLLEAAAEKRQFQFGQLILTQTEVYPFNSTKFYRLDNPSDLRRHIRETPFRSLVSTTDLPLDWYVPIQSIDNLPAVVETVYPGVLSDWAQHAIHPISFHEMAANQLGMYRQLAEIDAATVTRFVTGVCGRCIKHPIWHTNLMLAGSISCQRPCNLFLSTIKEADINEGQSLSSRSGPG